MQSLHDWIRVSEKSLLKIAASKQDAHKEAELLAAHVLSVDRAWILAHDKLILSPSVEKRFDKLLAKRKAHEPIAYIVETQPFLENDFFVQKGVLIPRPEAEELVLHALASIPKQKPTQKTFFIDIGTGSGAIGISVALARPNIPVIATDVSIKALAIAQKNAKQLGVKNISFLKTSLWSPMLQEELAHKKPKQVIIAANLPYLPHADKTKLAKDIVSFEPASALFAGKDGLLLIQRFLKQWSVWNALFPSIKASAILEFDPEQATALLQLAKSLFPKANARVIKDQCGRKRFLEIK